MEFFKKLIIVLFCMSLCFSCTEPDDFLDEPPMMLKKAKVKVMPSIETDALLKAKEDWQNITDALDNADQGETVLLGEGTFYLHKTIIRWDFNGTLKGAGRNETIIQTAPGYTFDRSASPDLEWSFESNDGHFMICFPHQTNSEKRTVVVSDLKIVINEPCDSYYIKKTGPNIQQNTLQAINVHYENLVGGAPGSWGDLSLTDKINLNVLYKNITVIGEEGSEYLGSGFSVKAGLTAFGASTGIFEAKNIYMENVANGMLLHAFCGENSKITVKNTKINNIGGDGIYSFLGACYNLTGNNFKNISGMAMQFFGNNPFETFDMPTNLSSVVKDNILTMNSTSAAIMGDRINNVQVYNNKITGTASSGIQVNFGFEPDNCNNWSVKNNNMCDLSVTNSAGATVILNKVVESEVKNNANQVVGGSSATDPSNIIGEDRECEDS